MAAQSRVARGAKNTSTTAPIHSAGHDAAELVGTNSQIGASKSRTEIEQPMAAKTFMKSTATASSRRGRRTFEISKAISHSSRLRLTAYFLRTNALGLRRLVAVRLVVFSAMAAGLI